MGNRPRGPDFSRVRRSCHNLPVNSAEGSPPGAADDPLRTRWSRIRERDYTYLIGRYWKPIRRFLSTRVGSVEDAEEITQEVFTAFFEKDLLSRVQEGEGSFRRFLFHVARQFLIDRCRHDTAAKRDAGRNVPLEKAGDPRDPSGLSPQDSFDREWYLDLFNRARASLKQHYEKRDRLEVYRSFRLFFFGDDDGRRLARKDVADELGLTEAQVRNNVHRAKKVFIDHLVAAIAEYTTSEEEIRAELGEMVRFLDRYLDPQLPESRILVLPAPPDASD